MTKSASSNGALTLVVTPGRRSVGLFGGAACIGYLDRGHIDRDRHREHRSHRCTSLLRHFITLTLPPGVLSSGMPLGSTMGALIARAGAPVGGAAGHGRALAGTKNIAVIAQLADAHRHAAAPAAIQPVALLPLLHRTPPQHWTVPGCTGLNAVAEDRPHRHRTAGGPGVLIGSRAFFAWAWAGSLSGNGSAPPRAQNPTPESTDWTFYHRWRQTAFDDDVNNVNKPKIILSRLPPPVVKVRLSPE